MSYLLLALMFLLYTVKKIVEYVQGIETEKQCIAYSDMQSRYVLPLEILSHLGLGNYLFVHIAALPPHGPAL